jgi:hypothetical protein
MKLSDLRGMSPEQIRDIFRPPTFDDYKKEYADMCEMYPEDNQARADCLERMGIPSMKSARETTFIM